jgi:hypothetical protein
MKAIDLRHSDFNYKKPYNDILLGDKVWVQGELFEVTLIFAYKSKNGTVVIRFSGKPVEGYNNLTGTMFENALYGSNANQLATVIKTNKAN